MGKILSVIVKNPFLDYMFNTKFMDKDTQKAFLQAVRLLQVLQFWNQQRNITVQLP